MDEDGDISLEAALRRLLAEIAMGDYRDKLGHQLVINTAYLEGVATLYLIDTLFGGTTGRPAGLSD